MVKIEEGKFYKTRDGRKVGPMKAYSFDLHPKERWTDGYKTYRNDGTFGGTFRECDLISEWEDTTTQGLIREVRRREIVPGQWGIVHVRRDGFLWVDGNKYTPEQLREAAHLFNQISEVLEDHHGQE